MSKTKLTTKELIAIAYFNRIIKNYKRILLLEKM